MRYTANQQALVEATAAYFADEVDFVALTKATKAYKALLHRLYPVDTNSEQGRDDIQLETGKALGTHWAALCLDDILRTRQFLRGIDAAITDKLRTQSRIQVLYAGTGPFATLLLPVLLRHPREAIDYTFIEINPFSFGILQQVCNSLGLADYTIQLVQEDATRYQISTDRQPDIIVSETMQQALAKEQQVAVFVNLMQQAKPDTVFIPEKIELHLGLSSVDAFAQLPEERQYQRIDQVFEVSKTQMGALLQSGERVAPGYSFPRRLTRVRVDDPIENGQLLILTDIQVYQDIKLTVNKSGLTCPVIVHHRANAPTGELTIETQYHITSAPELTVKIQ